MSPFIINKWLMFNKHALTENIIASWTSISIHFLMVTDAFCLLCSFIFYEFVFILNRQIRCKLIIVPGKVEKSLSQWVGFNLFPWDLKTQWCLSVSHQSSVLQTNFIKQVRILDIYYETLNMAFRRSLNLVINICSFYFGIPGSPLKPSEVAR